MRMTKIFGLIAMVVFVLGVALTRTCASKSPDGVSPSATYEIPVPPREEGVDLPVQADYSKNPALIQWKEVWKAKNQFEALQQYNQKFGMFLPTGTKNHEISYLAFEGPCGDEYVSLVKDMDDPEDLIWEIDKNGKLLNTWSADSSRVLRIEGKRVYTELVLSEDPEEYFKRENAFAVGKIHTYILELDSDRKFQILEKNEQSERKVEYKNVECPAKVEIESDYKYCVKDEKNNRIFVFQDPCT